MFVGIDLGTSAVKVVLAGDDDRIVDAESEPLEVDRPRPRWSEQSPEAWWDATNAAMSRLRARRGTELSGVRGVGLSGQMHGAVILDARDRLLRPAILWNDGRSDVECAMLEERVPESRTITGNRAMPGFTAPKVLWVFRNEPDVFGHIARVLLPKDWLRLRMIGDYVSEPSDAAGTLWLDVGARTWSQAMLTATGLDLGAMPRLVEGTEPSGTLRADVARSWGMSDGVVVAGGGGDNAAGAAGAGVVSPGEALLSLGTSGVIFVATDSFVASPERAVHAFCHCLPATWHQMSVILSAASCLSWIAGVLGARVDDLVADAERERRDAPPLAPNAPLFLPYLSGERTPHDDPDARGVLLGLSHATSRGDLVRAVLEGVAFALTDGYDALSQSGTRIDDISVVGGGARSAYWGRILAASLGRGLVYREGGDVGPAAGAARLGRIAATGEDPRAVCTAPPAISLVEPDPELRELLVPRFERFRALYRDLKPAFARERTTEDET